MPEIGQPSHVMEEDEFIDIPVDTECLIGYAPVAPVQFETEEGEDARVEISEPVIGGVMRSGVEGDDEEDIMAEAIETDPEKTKPEPAEYLDDMGTTADDIIEELTTRSVQLEDRVAHLKEQNMVHQERENQYRDLAYKREVENRELRQQLEQLQQDRAADGHHLIGMGEH